MDFTIKVPCYNRAPWKLRGAPDNCAAIAAWYVLRHFGITVRTDDLLGRINWNPGSGAYGLGIAVGLASYGLMVEVSADLDLSPADEEVRLRSIATDLGVRFREGMSVVGLIEHVREKDAMVVLLYRRDAHDTLGHFAVLRGLEGGHILLSDNAGPTFRDCSSFEEARTAGDICRQAIIVQRAEAAI